MHDAFGGEAGRHYQPLIDRRRVLQAGRKMADMGIAAVEIADQEGLEAADGQHQHGVDADHLAVARKSDYVVAVDRHREAHDVRGGDREADVATNDAVDFSEIGDRRSPNRNAGVLWCA